MPKKSPPGPKIEPNKTKLPDRIPITYLWFGKSVPEDYLISLSELDYPVIFIKNAQLDRKFSREIMDIEKSDYYRLQYLYQHGGIYSDFDNIINYDCLMKLLEPYRNLDKLIFMTDSQHNRAKTREMMNNLIFAPYAGMPLLRKMLDDVDENRFKIWNFSGMKHVAKYKQPLQVDMDKCVKHTNDWSWFLSSNEVLHKKGKPKGKFVNKLTKKKDIIASNHKLTKQIQQEKKISGQLRNDLNKVTSQLKKTKEEIAKINKNLPNQQNQGQRKQPELSQNLKPEANFSQMNEQQWSNQKLMMKDQIQQLSLKNDDLQYERNASFYAACGSLILVIILILIALVIKRRKDRSTFSKIGSAEKTVIEQCKLDSS